MTPPLKVLKHSRNGPEMDVAMCGIRGPRVVFSPSMAGTTCQDCKDRRKAAFSSKRVLLERAARKAQRHFG